MKFKKLQLINLSVIVFLLALPYFIFEGRLFIGGDDTRLFYVYPIEWIMNIALPSWFHLSTTGSNNPNQFIIPFLGLASLFHLVINSKVVVNYFFFSLPLILGFIFFQKFLTELIAESRYKNEIFIATLFYVFSPILILNQLSIFLYSVWLIAGIPLFLFLLIRYIKTESKMVLLISSIASIFFAFMFFSVPWFLGFLIPAIAPFFFLVIFYSRKQIFLIAKRFIIFISTIALVQAYWILPFVLNFLLIHKGTYSSDILSKATADTFTPTVAATATGNILYPLLNLFHRGIAVDFNWPLARTFFSFYDKFFYVSLLYIVIITCGLLLYKKFLPVRYRMVYLYALISFVIALFFFTVNIDIFKNLFFIFGKIPGFVMFRNFYDKFAFAYVFHYSLFFALSLIIFNNKFKTIRKYTNVILILIILVGIIPINEVVDRTLWKTQNIYSTANIPQEYIGFMEEIKKNLKGSSNILSVPYNIAAYTFIRDGDSNNMFIGTSPIMILSGVNDFSGNLSFNTSDTEIFKKALLTREYQVLNNILEKYAINYVFVTNNIPDQVKKSYLFEPKIISAQDSILLSHITDKLVFASSKGNYQMFQTKNQTPLISGNNVKFKKISPVQYRIIIRNLKQNELIYFRDIYNYDWKLFPEKVTSVCDPIYNYSQYNTTECERENLYTVNEIKYLFTKSIPEKYHTQRGDFGNSWNIDVAFIKGNLQKNFYTVNKDGSIDVTFTMYFVPQTYFYIGGFISLTTLLSLGILYFSSRKQNKKNNS